LTGNGIRAAWDGTPIHYNTRNPDNYVTEFFSDGIKADPCGRTDYGTPISPFYVPCEGTVGSSRRNQLIGPGLAQWDMTLAKSFKFTERFNLQFRWEVYNLLNRANFHYFPNNTIGTCGDATLMTGVLANGTCAAGQANFNNITKTSDVASGNPVIAQGGPRNMNFSLKLIF
jgi:hypothetical protein